MRDPMQVRVCGPLELYARGFGAELLRLGYTRISAGFQLYLMAHLSRWLVEESSGLAELTPSVVERFLSARRATGYTNYRTSKALEPLLKYLRNLGAVPLPPVTEPTALETVLERYRTYLAVERGLASSTIRYYIDLTRPFVRGRTRASGIDLFGLAPRDVTDFVLVECRNRPRGTAKLMVTALRSLLRFLHIEGELAQPLATAVPSVASWRLAGLPRSLEPSQVRKLLSSCDRRRATGRRDFAILMLLVRLAMRAGEVVGIELNDIDWCSGELVVRGKGDRHERLPLPSDVRRSDCWISAPRSSAHRTRPYLIRPSSGSTPKTHLHWGDQYRTRGREAGRPRQPKRAPPSAYCGDPNASRGCTT